jgi:hypothetical protein
MGKLTERYPGIKRLQAIEPDTTHDHILRLVQPYLSWQLVEIDTATSDIVIRRPSKPGEPSQLDDLIVLVGQVAAVWLRNQPSSRGQ